MKAIRKIPKEITALLLIIALGFLIRLYFWSYHSNTLTWDEGAHSLAGVMLARTILNGFNIDFIHKFINNYWATMGSLFFYPYGYDIMSTLSYLFFGFNQLSARIPSMAFSLLIIVAIYLLAKEMFDQEIGWLAAFIAVVNPYFIFWGGQALVDLPMICLMIYAIYFCFRAVTQGKIKYWLLSGTFVGLAGLMKPPGIIVFPLLIFIIIYYKGFNCLLKKPFILLTSVFLILSFSYFGFGLLAGYILPKFKIISPEIGTHIFKATFHWFSSAIHYAETKDPTWRTLAGWYYYPKLLPLQLGGHLTLLLSFLGTWRLIRNKNSRKVIYPILFYIIFIYLLFTFLNNKDTRYTMPYLPFFCILAAIGIKNLTSIFKQKRALFILPIILIFIAIPSLNQLREFVEATAYDSNLPLAAKVITNLKPGLIVPFSENNDINVQTISFYIAINDPRLRYSVYWPDKLKQANYIVSQEEINIPNAKSIFNEGELRVFINRNPRL